MHGPDDRPAPPDLAQGIAAADVADGAMLLGHVGDAPVLLARRGDEWFAIGATCTHYDGPLADGLLVGDTVRCPWHHACFSLRTGEAVRAPALDPVPCWRVEVRDGRVFVREKRAPQPAHARAGGPAVPDAIVVVGAGAAGQAAIETLRREGYAGRLTLLGADPDPPCDRPMMSKGLLAGSANLDQVPLRPPQFHREHDVELHLGARVEAIDVARHEVRVADGTRHAYERLLLATGAAPVRLDLPGGDLPHVHYLRTFAEGRALAAAAAGAKRAVVVGASFIGLEVAASLRARAIEVDVVAPGREPMEKVLGPDVGAGFRRLHEKNGVRFHLGTTPASIDARGVALASGALLPADLVVIGVGVRPALGLAEQAGLALDRGVRVNEFLETSAAGIFAAGDIARWPDPRTGEALRVEHWAVAQRQGETAALNMLGHRRRFDAVPFFWTEQYDLSLVYVGHASSWDEAVTEGEFDAYDFAVTYRRDGRALAYASVYRDLDSLRTEVAFEREASEAASGG